VPEESVTSDDPFTTMGNTTDELLEDI